MKTNILYFICFILAVFIAPQCKVESDPCLEVECLNGGDCDNGDCICQDWYEGSDCAIETRSKYYGAYSGLKTYDSGLAYAEYPNSVVSVGASSYGVIFITMDGLTAPLTFPKQGDFTIGPQPFGHMLVEGGYGSVLGNNLQFIIQGYLFGDYTVVTYNGYR